MFYRLEVQFTILTLTLNGGERLVSLPGRFTSEQEPQDLLYRRLSGSQSRSRHFEEKRKIFALSGIESQFIELQSVAMPTEIFRPPITMI
jgi:hypothetical protein